MISLSSSFFHFKTHETTAFIRKCSRSIFYQLFFFTLSILIILNNFLITSPYLSALSGKIVMIVPFSICFASCTAPAIFAAEEGLLGNHNIHKI